MQSPVSPSKNKKKEWGVNGKTPQQSSQATKYGGSSGQGVVAGWGHSVTRWSLENKAKSLPLEEGLYSLSGLLESRCVCGGELIKPVELQ